MAAQHDHAVRHAVDHLLHHEDDLVDRRHGGQRRLVVAADHQIVGQIDAQHDGLLQNQRAREDEKRMIKRAVPHQKRDARLFRTAAHKMASFLPQTYSVCDLTFLIYR